MIQTALWVALLLGTPKYNYFLTFDSNRAFLVRNDTAVFWIRAGKALKVISGQPLSSPEGKLFDTEQWSCYNHDFWAAMLKLEGISVAPDQKITLKFFENALKTQAKNKDIYANIPKSTLLILQFFDINFPNAVKELKTPNGGIVAVVNYQILAETDRYYLASESFMAIPEPSRGVISKQKALAAFEKAMDDPDFAKLMTAIVTAPQVTEGEELAAETLLVKAKAIHVNGDVGYLLIETNQSVTVDSIAISEFTGKFSVLDNMPKRIGPGTDSLSLTFSAGVADELISMGMVNVTVFLPETSFMSVANVISSEELAAGAPSPEESVVVETPPPSSEGEMGTITVEEESKPAAPSPGLFGTTLMIVLFFSVLIALVVFIYMLYVKVSSMTSKVEDFSNTAYSLKTEIANLSDKLSELEAASAKKGMPEAEASIQQILTILQGIQLQIEGATNDIKDSVESTGGRIKTEIIKNIGELKKSIENTIQEIQKAIAAEIARTASAAKPSAPPTRSVTRPTPPPPPQRATRPPTPPTKPSDLLAPAEPTPRPSPVEKAVPPTPPPSKPAVAPSEDRHRQELIRGMLASIAQKLRGLQENKMLKVVTLVRTIVNSIPETEKQSELREKFQKLLELAEGWERIKNSVRILRDAATRPGRDLQEIRMEFETLEATIEDISNALKEVEASYKESDFIPLLEGTESYTALKPYVRELMNLLGIEEFDVAVGKVLGDDVDQYEIWDVEGFGTRQVVVEVVSKGYRKAATGEIIKKPRIKVRLE